MLILAMDTCDARGSVALVETAGEGPPRTLSAEAHPTTEDYSTWLLPAVERVLQAAEKRLADITIVAAAAGPGSFTGIRIALTTAKAWNEVLHLPIAAVSRLEALASELQYAEHNAPPPGTGSQCVAASCDAQRGQLYAALYQRNGNGPWQGLGDERVVSLAELIAWVAEEAGSAPSAWVSLEPASLTNDAAWLQRAGLGERVQQAPMLLAPAIAQVAIRTAAAGRLTDALSLNANYIRRPDAEVKWKGYSRPEGARSSASQSSPPQASLSQPSLSQASLGQPSLGQPSPVQGAPGGAPRYAIRPFRPADASAVAQIAATSPESANWVESSYAEMSEKGYAAWVATAPQASADGGTVTGFLVTRNVVPEAEILNLAVHPLQRRTGIATALLRAATEALEGQGIRRVYLEVRSGNSAAISFYKKHLFRVTGSRPRYYQDPEDDALLMERNIHSA